MTPVQQEARVLWVNPKMLECHECSYCDSSRGVLFEHVVKFHGQTVRAYMRELGVSEKSAAWMLVDKAGHPTITLLSNRLDSPGLSVKSVQAMAMR